MKGIQNGWAWCVQELNKRIDNSSGLGGDVVAKDVKVEQDSSSGTPESDVQNTLQELFMRDRVMQLEVESAISYMEQQSSAIYTLQEADRIIGETLVSIETRLLDIENRLRDLETGGI